MAKEMLLDRLKQLVKQADLRRYRRQATHEDLMDKGYQLEQRAFNAKSPRTRERLLGPMMENETDLLKCNKGIEEAQRLYENLRGKIPPEELVKMLRSGEL